MSIDHKCDIDKHEMEVFFEALGIKTGVLDTYMREYHSLIEKVPEKYHCSQWGFIQFVYKVTEK